ncbi:MAG: 4-amino-4-deoxy-L-arabinose transferase-like glycosyltransferase [Planctomycetota bacterium]|jgi:4-amino-4-deoxy-L-arabinose transferase-like glycosyltransferase
MNVAESLATTDAQATASTESNLEFGRRWLFVVVALLALLLASAIRWETQTQIQGPLIADSVEYMTMARHATEGTSLTVKPVRSGLFPLMLAVPLWVESLFLDSPEKAGGLGTEDPSIALSVLLLFNLLSILGSYRLGVLLRGAWTGLLAAFFVATLPEFTRWSSDYLTDIPAAAFSLWALVFWVERKPFNVGVMLGLAVAVRYQCLIPLGAFFLVPVLLRRWSDLAKMFLGLVPAIIILGVTDFYYWGEAFHTFMLFVPRQLTTFLPADLVAKVFTVDAPAALPVIEVNQAIEATVAKGKLWYFEQSILLFTGALIYPILLFPLVRRSLRSRSGADMTMWITAFTLLVLSVQRYKEPRYLVAIVPMLSVLSATGVMWIAGGITKMLGRTTWIASVAGVVMLVVVGNPYFRDSRTIQRRHHAKPFGSFIDAVDSIPEKNRPCSIGMQRRWLISENHPVRGTGGYAWFSRDFGLFGLEDAVQFFRSDPATWPQLPIQFIIQELDYFIIPDPTMPEEIARLRWLNGNTLFDGYFKDHRQNEFGSLRLRTGTVTEDSAPFWNANDAQAREATALAKFAGDVEFISVDVEAISTSDTAVKITTRWRLPEYAGTLLTAKIDVINSSGHRIAKFPIWLIPDGEYGQAERSGAALRNTNYVNLLQIPDDAQLHIGVRIEALRALGQFLLPERMEVIESSKVFEGPAAQYKLKVPVKASRPLQAPPATVVLDSKRSG